MSFSTNFDRRRLVFFAGLFFSLLLCFGPLPDPDLPWHLAAGRSIFASGSVPRQDIFSWTMAGKPWVDFEWGTQIIFYCLERLGGAPALWFLKAATSFGLTLLFVGLLRLWKLSDIWIGLAAPAF